MSAEHVPDRPGWNCRTCGDPWPCPARKDMLRLEAETDPTGVTQYLASQYWYAMEDSSTHPLTGPSPRGLRERFLGAWVYEDIDNHGHVAARGREWSAWPSRRGERF